MNAAEQEALRAYIADRLIALEALFDRRYKLTFFARAPHLADGDVVVTNDTLEAVITALMRLSLSPDIQAPGVPSTSARKES
jgi:hypothetical protein